MRKTKKERMAMQGATIRERNKKNAEYYVGVYSPTYSTVTL